MTRAMAGRLAALGMAWLGAGCADPLVRPGTWQPAGVNDANLAMMAETPADLLGGRAAAHSRGELAQAAVRRLHDDKVKSLADVHTSSAGGGGAGQ